MKRAGTDILYFETGSRNKPTLHVDPGEVFEVQTAINAGPWCDGEQLREYQKKVPYGNPTSGCVFVNGVQPGDMITVEVLDMHLGPVGYTAFGPGTPIFYNWLDASKIGRHHKRVQIRDKRIRWNEHLEIPVRPMIGFVGVAPARECYHNGWNGCWGGNFDLQEITTGVRLHLKAECLGALLHVGDVHAIQGDGEICGAGGIESDALVRLKVDLTSPAPAAMHWPRLENAQYIMTCGFAKPAEEAFRIALEALLRWMVADYGFALEEAYMLLGQVLEARCSQFVDPLYTYVCKVPRQYLPNR